MKQKFTNKRTVKSFEEIEDAELILNEEDIESLKTGQGFVFILDKKKIGAVTVTMKESEDNEE